MQDKQSVLLEDHRECVADFVRETLQHCRQGPIVGMVREPEFETVSPSSSVAVTCKRTGYHQRLVGFSSMNPKESLRALLNSTLFPEMPSKLRLSIALAIVKDLVEAEPESGGYDSMISETSKLALRTD